MEIKKKVPSARAMKTELETGVKKSHTIFFRANHKENKQCLYYLKFFEPLFETSNSGVHTTDSVKLCLQFKVMYANEVSPQKKSNPC